uniref:procollagen-proline 4-dioxygenase n=1 Tax=Strigamia maritima TaxID=126957 RepID=T1ILC5_STRMM
MLILHIGVFRGFAAKNKLITKAYKHFQLERSKVANENIPLEILTDWRTSKNTWLLDDDKDDKLRHKLKIIMNRVSRIMGLNVHGLYNSEPMQVVNYGIGGHNTPHYDFFFEDPNPEELSDVNQGGATVFPRIGAAVWPSKGSAAFWYNLHKNGKRDLLTLHGGCPVLHGTKWSIIGNKWIDDINQVFKRPYLGPMTILPLLFLILIQSIKSDVYSSIAHLTTVFNADREIVAQLEKYIENDEANTALLRKYVDAFNRIQGSADADEIIGNPISAYRFIKRLTENWENVEQLLTDNSWQNLIQQIHNTLEDVEMPQKDDLQGAARGILRLQETYQLDASDLARGNISGIQSSIGLTTRDCIYLGKCSLKYELFDLAIEWYDHALHTSREETIPSVNREKLTLYLKKAIKKSTAIMCQYFQHNVAWQTGSEYPYIFVYDQKDFQHTFKELITDQSHTELEKLKILKRAKKKYKLGLEVIVDEETANYYALCRGEQLRNDSDEKNLNCYLSDRRDASFYINPIKVEVHSHDPLIITFHDVIYESEINFITEFSKPYLERSEVLAKNGEREEIDTRISQTTWMFDDWGDEQTLEKLKIIIDRVSRITGLNVYGHHNSEPLQVVNYGIGGHYIPHTDYLFYDQSPEQLANVDPRDYEFGGRLATLMFYLSDVPRGGATVFPRIGATVWPKKGSAAFWYNIHKHGVADARTLHGGCPVLLGSKWSMYLCFCLQTNGSVNYPKHLNCLVTLVQQTSDVYSSNARLTNIFNVEREIVAQLEKYIEKAEAKTALLRKYIDAFNRIQGSADADEIIGNPISAYRFIKRLTENWENVEQLLTDNSWKNLIQQIQTIRQCIQMPQKEDLEGAAIALLRLQETYQLDASDLANGNISGIQSSVGLTTQDCIYLGQHSSRRKLFDLAIEWYEHALHALHMSGEETNTQEIKLYLEEAIKAVEFPIKLKLDIKQNLTKQKHNLFAGPELLYDEEIANYYALCRGEQLRKNSEEANLNCYLSDRGDASFYINPIKVEVNSHDPLILTFHDVIYESEYNYIKKFSKPLLRRSKIGDSFGDSSLGISKFRTSQNAWLSDDEKDDQIRRHFKTIMDRLSRVTGLNIHGENNSEALQVANYGIGGHYTPHLDCLFTDRDLNELSDVKRGGATVFPLIGAAVWPRKGSAVFWYNILRNGEEDHLTLHAGCPVLLGSKWIGNKWIHELNQVFNRPCSLNPKE